MKLMDEVNAESQNIIVLELTETSRRSVWNRFF